jgi:hypothetical protein
MKPLKYEEILRNEYCDLAGTRASIREFSEKDRKNQQRLTIQRSAPLRPPCSNKIKRMPLRGSSLY